MDDRQPQFKDYEPMPLTLEAARQLAFQARLRLGHMIFDVPEAEVEVVQRVLPAYAEQLAQYLNGQYWLPFGPLGGALVHFIIPPGFQERSEEEVEDYVAELMGWKTILTHPELLLELLVGTADFMVTLHNAHQNSERYVEIMQTRPITYIGRVLCQSRIRAMPWYEITPEMLP